MKRREVLRALRRVGCVLVREGGEHSVWGCPCGQHRAAVPRHSEISAGVVGSIEKQMGCLPRGWLG